MSGYHACVERVEPARVRVVPRPVLEGDVIVDAVAPGLCECAIGELKYPDGARRRSVYVERVPAESPAPVRPCHGVTAALRLRESSQQFRCDDRRGVLVEER